MAEIQWIKSNEALSIFSVLKNGNDCNQLITSINLFYTQQAQIAFHSTTTLCITELILWAALNKKQHLDSVGHVNLRNLILVIVCKQQEIRSNFSRCKQINATVKNCSGRNTNTRLMHSSRHSIVNDGRTEPSIHSKCTNTRTAFTAVGINCSIHLDVISKCIQVKLKRWSRCNNLAEI